MFCNNHEYRLVDGRLEEVDLWRFKLLSRDLPERTRGNKNRAEISRIADFLVWD
jgi:hypothetical protein